MSSNLRDKVAVITTFGLVASLVTQSASQWRLSALEQEVQSLRAELSQFGRSEQLAGSYGRRPGEGMTEEFTDWPALQELSDQELEGTVAGAGAPAPGTPLRGPEPMQEKAARESAARLTPKIEKGGVLLPRGKFQIEPKMTYSHTSSRRVGLSGFSVFDVVFIGEIFSEEIDRDIIAPSTNFRYGLTNQLQAELEVPGRYQRQESLSGPIEERNHSVSSDLGLSDIEGGLFYQFAHETDTMPNMIAHARLKFPTGHAPIGSEAWGLKGGLIAIKSSDPVALFSNMAYSINFPTDLNGQQVNQGDSFEYSLGMAYALNYNLALNLSFDQLFIGESMINGGNVAGSRLVVANLKGGVTYAMSKNMSCEFSVGAGLTEDSPDVSVSLSFPYTF